MFNAMKFGINYPRSFFEILKPPLLHSGDFNNFKKQTQQAHPKFQLKPCDY